MSVRQFLINQNLIAAHDVPNSQGQFRINCPKCQHKNDKCYVDGTGKGVFCMHCKFRSTQRSFERRYEPPTPEETALENYVQTCHLSLLNNVTLMTWFADRGMDAAVVQAQRFGYHDPATMYQPTLEDETNGLLWPNNGQWMFKDHIIIPYIRDGVVTTVRGRVHPSNQNTPGTQKYMSLSGHRGQVYYPSSIDPELPVVVTEGEFDAVILRVNGIQAIGVPGAQNAKVDWFSGFHNLYLAFDGDDAGREGGDKLLKSLVEVRRIELPDGFDSSDYVLNFGIDSFKTLMQRAVLYLHGKPQKEDRFSTIVTDYENWAWTNGSLLGPAISWAPRFEKMMSGWAPGLILVGAEANSGKSCFKVKSLYELCRDNPDDTIGVYLSLDDTVQEAMTRLLSLHSGIDFNIIRTPKFTLANDPVALQHYTEAIESLKLMDNLIIRDATYGRSLTYLRSFFASLRMKYPDKRIVVFIDSLAKITGDTNDGGEGQEHSVKSNWKAYLASELKYLTTRHNLCIVTATDLRKMNGVRRPTRDDLKDAAELAYEANAILLCYNDLRRARDEAVLTWEYNGVTESVFEIIFDKNKITGMLGTIRFHMHGGTSNFWEATEDEDREYEQKARAQQARGKKEAA